MYMRCAAHRHMTSSYHARAYRARGVRGSTFETSHAASFQKFNLEKWAQPLGDLSFQRAC